MEDKKLLQLGAYDYLRVTYWRDREGFICGYNRISGSLYVQPCGEREYKAVDYREIIPHLRPMGNLDRSITVKDYNDGTEFTPSDELVRLGLIYSLPEDWDQHIWHFIKPGTCPLEVIDLLNLWHFDYNRWIEQGEAKVKRDEDIY